MNKTYVIGINDEAISVLQKLKQENKKVTTVLINETKIDDIDIFIKYDYCYNNFNGKGYKGIANDLLESIKKDVAILLNQISDNDKIVIFNNLFKTASLEMFYYLCDKLSSKSKKCYILVCSGYQFLGKNRNNYNMEILNKIYKLNSKIYEFDGDEVSKRRNAFTITSKINCVYEEFFDVIKDKII